jgi:hypothetical protein
LRWSACLGSASGNGPMTLEHGSGPLPSFLQNTHEANDGSTVPEIPASGVAPEVCCPGRMSETAARSITPAPDLSIPERHHGTKTERDRHRSRAEPLRAAARAMRHSGSRRGRRVTVPRAGPTGWADRPSARSPLLVWLGRNTFALTGPKTPRSADPRRPGPPDRTRVDTQQPTIRRRTWFPAACGVDSVSRDGLSCLAFSRVLRSLTLCRPIRASLRRHFQTASGALRTLAYVIAPRAADVASSPPLEGAPFAEGRSLT